MLAYAQKIEAKSPLGIQYISEINENNFGTFDVILAVYVIPYLTNQEDLFSMFESIYKMLKPGGKFITLPVHPEFSQEEHYYTPFGFNLFKKEPLKDASKLKLELRMPPHDIDLEAYYWSKESLNNTLLEVGFKNIHWPKLEVPDNLPANLIPYLECPHAAIIEAYK